MGHSNAIICYLVHNIPRSVDKNIDIKIAIIGGGVDIELCSDIPDCIAGGMSFHTGKGASGQHHFPSLDGHGAKMADCILEIFPKAKFYIARLMTYPGRNAPTFTTASAAEGISWAVEQEVDIILMSWTIDEGSDEKALPTEKASIAKMREALSRANEHDILMFCAAKDMGAEQGFNPGYPQNSGVSMFCVGGATPNGEKSGRVGIQKVDLLCPESFSTGIKSSEYREPSGSSIAAALAVGLAGLLLYCTNLENAIRIAAKISGDQMELKDYPTMKALFSEMVGLHSNRYLPVHKYFNTGDFAATWDEDGLKVLEKIVGTIWTELGKANSRPQKSVA